MAKMYSSNTETEIISRILYLRRNIAEMNEIKTFSDKGKSKRIFTTVVSKRIQRKVLKQKRKKIKIFKCLKKKE